MVQINDLVRYCDELLCAGDYRDYAPNGLQVAGTRGVRRVATAVTASRDVLEQAERADVDAILVHHGYFWKGEDPRVVGMKAERLRRLLTSGISLVAYHLPLDAHRELGNNACLGRRLELRVMATHDAGGVPGLLWFGELETPESADAFVDRVGAALQRRPLRVGDGPAVVQRVAWCTGAAQGFLGDAVALGADVYISGEVSERTTHEAREQGVHYLAAGHHATERYGVQALGSHLAEVFAVDHLHLEDDNPV
ncbi:Nif3-like dinuclear metal center hexameric protein [Arhodomonas sp. AD133]|uniref:Nif3-like dinuclear metal center hexameric protein n=1 Tax=Arhodomonas sp. AD133 TaxID=3415009 RepID=UPI003EB94755